MKRLLPPILMLLCFVGMLVLHRLLPVRELIPPPANLSGLAFILAGLSLAIAGRLTFARAGTEIYTFREPGRLVTGGVFRVSRNPMYLGMLLLLIGAAILLGSLTPFLAALAFAIVADRWYIRYEEAAMAAKFGEDYRAYQRRTRRWL